MTRGAVATLVLIVVVVLGFLLLGGKGKEDKKPVDAKKEEKVEDGLQISDEAEGEDSVDFEDFVSEDTADKKDTKKDTEKDTEEKKDTTIENTDSNTGNNVGGSAGNNTGDSAGNDTGSNSKDDGSDMEVKEDKEQKFGPLF